jgi:D-methionine transport system ATP-binding protein
MRNAALIEFENVSKNFDINGQEQVIIDGIDLKIDEKDIFGLVGETGSGKSTLLRMMTGFIEPDGGEIRLMGRRLDKKSRHELVRATSMIFQHFNLLMNLNVRENVLLPVKLRRGNQEENRRRALELLAFVGLKEYENAYIRTLSGGQKQRVAIARSLMTRPRVIFCDEPTSALDEKMSFEVLSLLHEINRRFGTTIVVVSHNISVIKALCNRVAIIENGRIADVIALNPERVAPVSYQEAFRP